MELSLRLQCIANKILENDTIVDIGTDHAYIPIFLCKNAILKKAIATDISKGSLDKAKTNVLNHALCDKIETRLSNGLDKITLSDNINTVIIAGMGGKLAIDILEKNRELTSSLDKIVIQPQKDIPEVRKYIHSINFFIESDEILIDEKKYYNVMVAKNNFKNTFPNLSYSKVDYIFGKFQIEQKSKVLKSYIEQQLKSMEIVIKNIENTNAKSRISELNANYKLYKEVLECL